MPKGKPSTSRSRPTGLWRPCPEGIHAHPKVRVACQVYAGPSAFWLECSSCKTRMFIAPKHLSTKAGPKPVGMRRHEAEEEGFLCL